MATFLSFDFFAVDDEDIALDTEGNKDLDFMVKRLNDMKKALPNQIPATYSLNFYFNNAFNHIKKGDKAVEDFLKSKDEKAVK